MKPVINVIGRRYDERSVLNPADELRFCGLDELTDPAYDIQPFAVVAAARQIFYLQFHDAPK